MTETCNKYRVLILTFTNGEVVRAIVPADSIKNHYNLAIKEVQLTEPMEMDEEYSWEEVNK